MIGFTVLFKNPVEQLFKPQVIWGYNDTNEPTTTTESKKS